jgi:hypothetical protein
VLKTYERNDTITAVVAVTAGAVAGAAITVLAAAARGTSTISVAGPDVHDGQELVLAAGTPAEQSLVVRRVMKDLTGQHVALVRSRRWWHRWRWTRGWL